MPVTFLCMMVEKSRLSFPEMVWRTSGKIDKKDAETSKPKIHLSPLQHHFMLNYSVWAGFRSQSCISWVNTLKSTHSWNKNLAPNTPHCLTSWKHKSEFNSSKIHCTCWCEETSLAWSPYSSVDVHWGVHWWCTWGASTQSTLKYKELKPHSSWS